MSEPLGVFFSLLLFQIHLVGRWVHGHTRVPTRSWPFSLAAPPRPSHAVPFPVGCSTPRALLWVRQVSRPATRTVTDKPPVDWLCCPLFSSLKPPFVHFPDPEVGLVTGACRAPSRYRLTAGTVRGCSWCRGGPVRSVP